MTLSDELLDISLHAALSAIELYNKPDFKYREQVFTILCINAWELVLKAKLVKDANENITSIYVPAIGGGYKTNRTNNPMTIDITGAMHKLELDSAVIANLEALIELRDTSVHFYHSQALSYVVFSLGVAALKNYQVLLSTWFGKSLREYNFYILPLAFAYNFKTLSQLDIEKEPEVIGNIIRAVSASQTAVDQSHGFYFALEIAAEVKSAKKYSGASDITAVIDTEKNPGTAIFVQTQRVIDKYPITYRELMAHVKAVRPDLKEGQIHSFMQEQYMKTNPAFCAPSFLSKKQERKYKLGVLPANQVTFVYNEDAVRYIIETLKVKV